ncbi:hypothetical protein KJ039_05710 [bacterium]|nr:hypothetical protein [bacterium]
MNKSERLAYDQVIRTVAKRLGIPLRGNIENAIIEYCKKEVDKLLASRVHPKNLIDLLNYVATSLGIIVKEIHKDKDLDELEQEIPPEREPIIGRLKKELNDQTDALILERKNRHPWEQPYLAVINCRGSHSLKKYFSKWHEIVHLLLDGKQLRFAFRRTPSLKREPEEILVDRVAAVLAHHPAYLEPALEEENLSNGKLSFEMIDRIRKKLAPEASRLSTTIACIKKTKEPICFLRARLGFKKDEERLLFAMEHEVIKEKFAPVMKLRIREATSSLKLEELEIRFHKNMEIPTTSIISKAFDGNDYESYTGAELLQTWTTSKGSIGYGKIEIEAKRIPSLNEVWAIIYIKERKGKKHN